MWMVAKILTASFTLSGEDEWLGGGGVEFKQGAKSKSVLLKYIQRMTTVSKITIVINK